MTKAQKRALEWLPPDGSWRTKPGRLVSALNSLSLAWPHCVQDEYAQCGPRGGWMDRWRLTAEGVARAVIEGKKQ
jgi:hypothetical protein